MLFLLSLIVLLFVACNRMISRKRYYSHLPTTSGVYPDNRIEIEQVEQAISARTKHDVDAHVLTDESVVPLFVRVLRNNGIHVNQRVLKSIILQPKHLSTIQRLKRKHNRARPWQIKIIDNLESATAHTPAYPAGHAYQAWVLYRVLSSQHPSLKQELYNTAKYCDRIRVLAGLHYPSDGKYSKKLVMALRKNEL